MSEYLLHGAGAVRIDKRPYETQLETARNPAEKLLHDLFPNEVEYETKSRIIFDYAFACENVCMEIGLQCGIVLAMQIIANTYDSFSKQFLVHLKGDTSHAVKLGADAAGNITRLNNALKDIEQKLNACGAALDTLHKQLEQARVEANAPFEKEDELNIKTQRLAELNILLNMDEKTPELIDTEPEESGRNDIEYVR